MDVKGPLSRLLDVLIQAEIVDSELARAIRQVYAVCSPAIHGEDVSQTKVNFVREVAPELQATLRKLRETSELRLGPLSIPARKRATAES